MSGPVRHKMDEEADKWFYDLGALGKQVERNNKDLQRTDERLRVYGKQNRLLAIMTLGALMLLAFRMEVTFDRQAEISYEVCLGGRQIIEKFNTQQKTLAGIDREAVATAKTKPAEDLAEAKGVENTRNARIRAYETGYIPVPTCDKP